MSLTITTLLENQADDKKILTSEHGLSFYIEKDGHALLFDTGKTGAFVRNAEVLGKELTAVEAVVISHNHYDHAGGFRRLIETASGFQLYLGDGFFRKKFGVTHNEVKYLGCNFDEGFLKASGIHYSFINEPKSEVLPGIYVLAGYPRKHEDEGRNRRFQLPDGEGWSLDEFNDEICLAIDTVSGMVVVLGCSHPGMRNMVDAVRARFDKHVCAVVGGTHLVAVEGEALEQSCAYLADESIGVVAVSHCTGEAAVKILEQNANFRHNHSGGILHFE